MEFVTIPAKDLRHTRVAQEWIEEGRQEGRQEGEARGRAAEAAVVTVRLLSRRCGPLGNATTVRIKALPLVRLEALAVDAVFSVGEAFSKRRSGTARFQRPRRSCCLAGRARLQVVRP